MAIADIVIPTLEVEYRNYSFNVRGLTFADVGVLLRDYPEEVEVIIEQFMALPDADDDAEELEFMGRLVTDFVDVIAYAIALAANEVDQVEKVKTFPPEVMIDAINKIWQLTVEEAGGLKKLVGGSATMMQDLVMTLGNMRQEITGTSALESPSAS